MHDEVIEHMTNNVSVIQRYHGLKTQIGSQVYSSVLIVIL